MPDLSLLWSPAPYHILSYGTLLGSSLYQSFINAAISYRALPRAQFATLQSALLPIYFGIQTALPALLALTYPGLRTLSPLGAKTSSNGISGVLEPQNRLTVLLPLSAMLVLNALNWIYIGPATTRLMKERKHQETRDGKKYSDKGPQSKEMERLNRVFGRMHGASAVTNLVSLGVAVWYGVLLAERVQ